MHGSKTIQSKRNSVQSIDNLTLTVNLPPAFLAWVSASLFRNLCGTLLSMMLNSFKSQPGNLQRKNRSTFCTPFRTFAIALFHFKAD